jgi:broad specificity phosphatase PhoE
VGLLLLVRHGQASFGADDYDVLSEPGFAQGRALGAALSEVAPAVVLHGGMRRQRETAEALVEGAGWDVPLETDARWAEFDHLEVLAAYGGAPDGADRREFQRYFEEATSRWQAESPGWPAFQARVRAGLDEAAARAGSGRTGVVVTSGGVIAAVAAHLLGAADPGTWQRLNAVVVNASVTRVLVGATGARLLTFNEHTHLDRELVTYR